MALKKIKGLAARMRHKVAPSAKALVRGAVDRGLAIFGTVARLKALMRRGMLDKRRLLFITCAVILLGFGFCLLTNLWITEHTEHRIYNVLENVPVRHTAIVLGALVYSNRRPSMVLADRLLAALDLYKKGKVKKILLSGDHSRDQYDEVNTMYLWMRKRGVKDADLFLDHAGLRTLDTMARAAKVFDVKQAVICTQAFHLPRALFLAAQFGIDAVGLTADRRRYRHHFINLGREFFARSVAVLDTHVYHRGPKFLGQVIPVRGDGRASHDSSTPKL